MAPLHYPGDAVCGGSAYPVSVSIVAEESEFCAAYGLQKGLFEQWVPVLK